MVAPLVEGQTRPLEERAAVLDREAREFIGEAVIEVDAEMQQEVAEEPPRMLRDRPVGPTRLEREEHERAHEPHRALAVGERTRTTCETKARKAYRSSGWTTATCGTERRKRLAISVRWRPMKETHRMGSGPVRRCSEVDARAMGIYSRISFKVKGVMSVVWHRWRTS